MGDFRRHSSSQLNGHIEGNHRLRMGPVTLVDEPNSSGDSKRAMRRQEEIHPQATVM